jgi:hypothetical protein
MTSRRPATYMRSPAAGGRSRLAPEPASTFLDPTRFRLALSDELARAMDFQPPPYPD